MKLWITSKVYFDFRAIWTTWRRYHRRDSAALQWHKYLGWGFYRTEPIRQGFWLNERNEVVVGFFASESNFHYAKFEGAALIWYRSSHNTPEPALRPVPFEEGLHRLLEQFRALRQGDRMLKDLKDEGDG